MSEEQDTTEITEVATEAKAKRNSIPRDQVDALIAGIPQYDKASFLMVGHRDGVRLAIPKTLTGVSRAYFYGLGNYDLIPRLPCVEVFSPERRRELRKGGIMAEIDFTIGGVAAVDALRALIEVVRVAPPPAPKALKKPKLPREPKASPSDETGGPFIHDEGGDEPPDA